MPRILLVGQAPDKQEQQCPLAGRVGKKLAKLAGISEMKFLALTERITLLDQYPGRTKSGRSKFSMKQAVRAAEILHVRIQLQAPRSVIFVGRNVARAYARAAKVNLCSGPPGAWFPFEWHEFEQNRIAWIYHPSRWYNFSRNKQLAEQFLQRAFRYELVRT